MRISPDLLPPGRRLPTVVPTALPAVASAVLLSVLLVACGDAEQTTLAPPHPDGAPQQSTASAGEPAHAVAAAETVGAPDEPEPPAEAAAAAAVVAWWDDSRAAAWRALDAAALEELYLPDSRAGDLDAEHLSAFAAAGVRVRGWQTARASVREVRRGPGTLVVDVIAAQRDVRVGIATRRGAGVEQTDRRLPASDARRLRLTLHWSWPAGGWAVGRVRPVLSG